ncbi:MAG: hypothetical protein R3F61_20930 [Myxococcota bacterium]
MLQFATWFALAGCTPSSDPDPLALPDAEVQEPRYVGCTTEVVSEYSVAGTWTAYGWLERAYDEWGNVAFELREDEQGGRSELSSTYHGRWLLHREVLDTFGSPVVSEVESWTWDGNHLLERSGVRNGEPSLTTYTTTGANPYDHARVDLGADGTVDRSTAFTWIGDHIVREAEDDGDDGSVERSWAYVYDPDGYLLELAYDEDSGAYDHLERTLGGPRGNVLTSRREISDGTGAPSVTFQDLEWAADWSASTSQVFVDGTLFEIDTSTYDPEGRLLSFERTFPDGAYTTVHDLWDWSCP